MLLAIDCEVVAQYTPAEAEEADIDSKKPSAHKEEAVEREFELGSVLRSFVLDIKRVGVHESYACNYEGKPEHELEVVRVFIYE